eukprot:4914620-Prymnesium_polylepis.1
MRRLDARLGQSRAQQRRAARLHDRGGERRQRDGVLLAEGEQRVHVAGVRWVVREQRRVERGGLVWQQRCEPAEGDGQVGQSVGALGDRGDEQRTASARGAGEGGAGEGGAGGEEVEGEEGSSNEIIKVGMRIVHAGARCQSAKGAARASRELCVQSAKGAARASRECVCAERKGRREGVARVRARASVARAPLGRVTMRREELKGRRERRAAATIGEHRASTEGREGAQASARRRGAGGGGGEPTEGRPAVRAGEEGGGEALFQIERRGGGCEARADGGGEGGGEGVATVRTRAERKVCASGIDGLRVRLIRWGFVSAAQAADSGPQPSRRI